MLYFDGGFLSAFNDASSIWSMFYYDTLWAVSQSESAKKTYMRSG